MSHAIRFHKTGGPEVLVWEEVEIGKPGPGEAHVRHTAVGVNFVDIYIRTGLYPVALPSGLGTAAAGTVEEIGPGVKIYHEYVNIYAARAQLTSNERVAEHCSRARAHRSDRLASSFPCRVPLDHPADSGSVGADSH